jgi:hypothetical protein
MVVPLRVAESELTRVSLRKRELTPEPQLRVTLRVVL